MQKLLLVLELACQLLTLVLLLWDLIARLTA